MATETAIQWTKFPGYDEGWSWNPIKARNLETGKAGNFCVKIDAGCANCYASSWNTFRGNGLEYVRKNADKMELYLDEKALLMPLRTRKKICFFTNSLTDLFGLDFGVTEKMLARIYAVMALTPQHLYLNLTKRSKARREWLTKASQDTISVAYGRLMNDLQDAGKKAEREYIQRYVRDRGWGNWKEFPVLSNVFEGSSIACQKDLHQLDDLMQTPAAYRFVSYEPAIEGVDLSSYLYSGWYCPHHRGPCECHNLNFQPRFDWVIQGGESGYQARPFDIQWARETIRQCREAGVPVFLKQLGAKPYNGGRTQVFGSCAGTSLPIRDKKGGATHEWPVDLQDCREFPRIGGKS